MFSSAFKPPSRSSSYDIGQTDPPRFHAAIYGKVRVPLLYQDCSQDNSQTKHVPGSQTDGDGRFRPKVPVPLLAKRYRFIRVLGEGISAVLIQAEDTFNQSPYSMVAIKIMHTIYYEIGHQEMNILRELNQEDTNSTSFIVKLLNSFTFDSHFCVVFELLNYKMLTSVFTKFKKDAKRLSMVRKVAVQMLQAVGLLRQANIIHTDIKPENILATTDLKIDSMRTKMIDFGNAIHCNYRELSMYYDDFDLMTRSYRAPEVMFGLPFSFEIDMWALGCTLAELFLGEALFDGDSKQSVIESMYGMLGPMPKHLAQTGKFYSDLKDYVGVTPSPNERVLHRLMMKLWPEGCESGIDPHFGTFLLGMLQYKPDDRFTPWQAFQHPFIAQEVNVKLLMPIQPGMPKATSMIDSKYCPASPHINDKVKSENLSSIELLRHGTKCLEVRQVNKVKSENLSNSSKLIFHGTKCLQVQSVKATDAETLPMAVKEESQNSPDECDRLQDGLIANRNSVNQSVGQNRFNNSRPLKSTKMNGHQVANDMKSESQSTNQQTTTARNSCTTTTTTTTAGGSWTNTIHQELPQTSGTQKSSNIRTVDDKTQNAKKPVIKVKPNSNSGQLQEDRTRHTNAVRKTKTELPEKQYSRNMNSGYDMYDISLDYGAIAQQPHDIQLVSPIRGSTQTGTNHNNNQQTKVAKVKSTGNVRSLPMRRDPVDTVTSHQSAVNERNVYRETGNRQQAKMKTGANRSGQKQVKEQATIIGQIGLSENMANSEHEDETNLNVFRSVNRTCPSEGRSQVARKGRLNLAAEDRTDMATQGRSHVATKDRSHRETEQRSHRTEEIPHIATESRSRKATERRSCRATEDRSPVATEEIPHRATKDRSHVAKESGLRRPTEDISYMTTDDRSHLATVNKSPIATEQTLHRTRVERAHITKSRSAIVKEDRSHIATEQKSHIATELPTVTEDKLHRKRGERPHEAPDQRLHKTSEEEAITMKTSKQSNKSANQIQHIKHKRQQKRYVEKNSQDEQAVSGCEENRDKVVDKRKQQRSRKEQLVRPARFQQKSEFDFPDFSDEDEDDDDDSSSDVEYHITKQDSNQITNQRKQRGTPIAQMKITKNEKSVAAVGKARSNVGHKRNVQKTVIGKTKGAHRNDSDSEENVTSSSRKRKLSEFTTKQQSTSNDTEQQGGHGHLTKGSRTAVRSDTKRKRTENADLDKASLSQYARQNKKQKVTKGKGITVPRPRQQETRPQDYTEDILTMKTPQSKKQKKSVRQVTQAQSDIDSECGDDSDSADSCISFTSITSGPCYFRKRKVSNYDEESDVSPLVYSSEDDTDTITGKQGAGRSRRIAQYEDIDRYSDEVLLL